ncbi:SLC13 family permease [Cytobacillus purgationiresistens]|uniref:Anion transporter n=1 Tax=Cytobacillus purgationiresistens TaxID=863449 RepID=A0ABU0AHW9_9BACI|nr:SLC13 family permease [Cytobacillus purgationiresistens]MDQ0270849.1 anion transporter [Cytobacillus purgationiresistens]
MSTRMAKHDVKHHQMKILNQYSVSTQVIVGIHIFFLIFIVMIDSLDYAAKVSLFAFLSAIVLSAGTKIPAGYVAVSLIIFIVLMKASEPELLYQSLAEEVVWLMVGSFIIGEAVKHSGIADRFSYYIIRKSNRKNRIIAGLTSVLITSAFFIPSTSGRAAITMPMLENLSSRFTAKERSVLSLMAPVVILMSTSATIIGAGSHLIGIGLLESASDQSISFLQWLVWGVPFSIVITVLSVFIMKRMLWPKEGSKNIEENTSIPSTPSGKALNNKEKITLLLLILMIIGWTTESVHGYDISFITMIGAILAMAPGFGVISWKQGIKAVSWNLILFVAAAAALGKVLVENGVILWIEKKLFMFLPLFNEAPEWLLVTFILLITTTSHLYITSHTTRAIVFIPGLILFSQSIGVNASAIVFISLIGMNYCITFPVCSKALMLFYEESDRSFHASDLIKISTVLLPLYILLMLAFYFTFWRWTGMYLYPSL